MFMQYVNLRFTFFLYLLSTHADADVQLKQSGREKMSELKKTNLQLQQSLQTCQYEHDETKQLLELARRSPVIYATQVYTVSQKKWGTYIMPHNSHKCGPILIFLSL